MNPFLRLSLFSLFLFLQNFLSAEEPMRTWTSSDGRTLEARFIEQVGSNVRIKNEAGREFTLPMTRFSHADQEYVKDRAGMLMEPMRRDSRTFYQKDEQWDGYRKGGVLITAVSGKVETKAPPPEVFNEYEEVKEPVWIKAEVGQVLVVGHQVRSGEDGNASLLLTNGAVIGILPNTYFSVRTFFQDDVEKINPKETFMEMSSELSPSMIKFKLEEGELVVETKKLDKKSSFFLETQVGVAGIRGTAFRLQAKPESQNLQVLRGQVDLIGRDGKLTSVINGQETSMTQDQTKAPVILSTENKALIQKACSEIGDLVARKTLGELIKVREEANPPLTLIPDERGVEEALRGKIRRPRGRILPIDYERVGVIEVRFNEKSKEGFNGDNLDSLEDFPNVSRLAIQSSKIRNIKGINALKSLELLYIECNNADLKPLSRLKTLKQFAGPLDYLPFITNNKQIQDLWILTGMGGILERLERGVSIPQLDFSLFEYFPNLERFSLEWNSVYQSKDFEVLVEFEKLKHIKINQVIPGSLSDETVEEIRALLPNVEVMVVEKF